MSNKVVSATYRSIIDDVVSKIRPEFDEMGIEDTVLERLQLLWESRVVNSGVTAFVAPNGAIAEDEIKPIISHLEIQHPSLGLKKMPQDDDSYLSTQNNVQKEDSENGAGEPPNKRQRTGEIKLQSDSDQQPSSSTSAEIKPGPEASGSATEGDVSTPVPVDEDAIDSGLDDSDGFSETGERVDGEDIVLCLYDKVHRVKNKWRANLKDGVMSIGGKDYLFSKSNGEFEW